MGVDHRASPRGDGAVAGGQVGAEGEQQDVPGLQVAERHRDEVAAGGLGRGSVPGAADSAQEAP